MDELRVVLVATVASGSINISRRRVVVIYQRVESKVFIGQGWTRNMGVWSGRI